MKKVLILKNWNWPDLLRQTPGAKGRWDEYEFYTDPLQHPYEKYNYVIVLNQPDQDYSIECEKDKVWAVMQEPPNEIFREMHKGTKYYSRVYTTDPGLRGRKYIHSHPAIAWHVNKQYDELIHCSIPEKDRELSWITSNSTAFKGHQTRLAFLERLKVSVQFDLYGRGLHYIKDKWDGLAPYRYSLAIENFSNPLYWSEKISDCFLSWTYPIYFGCTEIADFFPKESFTQIDINDKRAVDKIKEVVKGNLWKKNLDAIRFARELVLEKYQLFPFLVNEFNRQPESCDFRKLTIPYQDLPIPYINRAKIFLKKILRK